jgi:hypothetical protein
MSGPSGYEQIISLGVEISIQIEADDGLHEKSEYRSHDHYCPVTLINRVVRRTICRLIGFSALIKYSA